MHVILRGLSQIITSMGFIAAAGDYLRVSVAANFDSKTVSGHRQSSSQRLYYSRVTDEKDTEPHRRVGCDCT